MAILILSKSNNVHADAVEKQFASKDIIRVDADSLLQSPIVSVQKDFVIISHLTFNSSEITGVFMHHFTVETPTVDATALEKQLWISAWRNWVQWLEQALQKSVWINRPSAIMNSSPVYLQLDRAESLGFEVPDFIFTNSKKQLDVFAKEHGEIIVKTGPLLAGNLPNNRILTHKIDPSKINSTTLKHSPCLFQKYINKAFELRVYVIGDRVLSCQILSQDSEKSKIDWRNYDIANVPHFPYQLDTATEKRCISIVKQLGLEFGAIDLIITKTGSILFLECNSQGHWLWIEALTGLPITETIGKRLTD